jgi:hypothetical protein
MGETSTRTKRSAKSASRLKWTADEDATLLREWTLVNMRRLRQLLPGRSILAINDRAVKLGVSHAQTQGMMSLDALGRRFGVAAETMLKILERNGARLVRRHPSGQIRESRRKIWRTYADLDEAHEAFARWEREESASFAAKRIGIRAHTLRLRAMSAGLAEFNTQTRLLPEQWDELAKPQRVKRAGAALMRRDEQRRAA